MIRHPFRQSSSAGGAASPSQHVRPSGLRSGWSDVLELITEQSLRVGVFRRLFQTFTENIIFSLVDIDVPSAVEVFTTLRCINVHLLTYLLSQRPARTNQPK